MATAAPALIPSRSRILATVALTTAVLDMVVLVAFHLLQPAVDPITSATSEYVSGTAGVLSQVATCAVGIGALALAAALRTVSRTGFAGRVLLGVFGAAKFVQAFFPIDAPGTETTTAGLVHNLTGNIAFFVLPIAALLLLGTLRRRAPVVLTWLLLATTVAVLGADAVGAFGLAQRAYLVTAALWVIAAAAAVVRPRAGSDQR
ncbi:DUF998 domain-containing protein [Pseudactinotalea sp.]|uniref:DUF998 domain-containing protein n=1 Tax=Pseudactinotalea sp. TaxID=1926260 RepID=UPI003B3B039C